MLCLLTLLPAIQGEDLPILKVGEALVGEITDADTRIRTPTLDTNHGDAPVVGKTFRITIEEAGTQTIDVRSVFFDAYVVLREETDAILAEDDDGLLNSHARIVRALEPGRYLVDACALHAERGSFELSLSAGLPAELAPVERARLEEADLRARIRAIEERDGSESDALARALSSLGFLRWQQGRYAEARPLMERALSIREEVFGPAHVETAASHFNLAAQLHGLGDYAQARALYERALEIQEAAVGPDDPAITATLNNLGALLLASGDLASARPFFERSLEICQRSFGSEHPDTARALGFLAQLLYSQGDLESARALFARALADTEQSRGPDHSETAAALRNLAAVMAAQGDLAAARPLDERALEIDARTLAPEHPLHRAALVDVAGVRAALGDLDGARELYERALAILDRVHEPDPSELIRALEPLARLLSRKEVGSPEEARLVFERLLALRAELLGPDHSDVARTQHEFALTLHRLGDYAAARPLYELALSILERRLGPDHPETVVILANLGKLLGALGDYSAARPLLERALAIRERTQGPEHLLTAESLEALGHLHHAGGGDPAAARPLLERALAIDAKLLGSGDLRTASCSMNLGNLLRDQGDYAAARPLLESALAVHESVLGREHDKTAESLFYLAKLFKGQGDCDAARRLLERALAIQVRTYGPGHPECATFQDSLASVLSDLGDHAGAKTLFEQALATKERTLGPEHPDTGVLLYGLATTLWHLGDTDAARRQFERSLAISEKTRAATHQTSIILYQLAAVHRDQGDYEGARVLVERALSIVEAVVGPGHQDVARFKHLLAQVLADSGLGHLAWEVARSATRSDLARASWVLWSLSEQERLLFLEEGSGRLESLVSCAEHDESPGTDVETYELSLAWRGLASRSMLESRERLRAVMPAHAASVLAELQDVQVQLSREVYATADPEATEESIRGLCERRNGLKVELARIAGQSGMEAPSVADLRASLEPGTAFLDFLVHPSYDPAERGADGTVRAGRWSEDHLTAWIVRPDRELLELDLGLAAEIESAVKAWLQRVVTEHVSVANRGVAQGLPESSDASGARLRELLWLPIEAALQGVERVFVRPDSFLGTLPFEVIPLPGDRFLVEDKSFVYVATPLDLVARAEPASGQPSLFVVGGVDFERRPGPEDAVAEPHADGVLEREHPWSALPFTISEARTLGRLFETAVADGEELLLTGSDASEERLKQELPRFAFIHLATHGFFDRGDGLSLRNSAPGQALDLPGVGIDDERQALVGRLPGLLCGIVCAGANDAGAPGRDDGLLTAEEVLWLDVTGARLVVLSACETALGERRSGEGMIGLRRAFGLAGAEAVISSLWSVRDSSTSELMQGFYENLWQKGQGRAAALRNAQLELLASNRARYAEALPSTWGAFVLSGAWR
ncbi:MAG: CHAT domain-containing protein [Planctomycetes bacterium]|nr:CHAT domain-containing protein [Planctomycetota bacterium]